MALVAVWIIHFVKYKWWQSNSDCPKPAHKEELTNVHSWEVCFRHRRIKTSNSKLLPSPLSSSRLTLSSIRWQQQPVSSHLSSSPAEESQSLSQECVQVLRLILIGIIWIICPSLSPQGKVACWLAKAWIMTFILVAEYEAPPRPHI